MTDIPIPTSTGTTNINVNAWLSGASAWIRAAVAKSILVTNVRLSVASAMILAASFRALALSLASAEAWSSFMRTTEWRAAMVAGLRSGVLVVL